MELPEEETVRNKLIGQCRAILAQLESPATENVEIYFFGEEYYLESETLDGRPLF